jgi:outer membrane autotransporter protein
LTPSLSYSADDIFLTLVRNQSSFSSVAQTSVEASVGTAVQKSSERALSGDGAELLTAIENLSAPGARAAFQGLSGEGVVASENVAFVANDVFLWSLHDRGQQWRMQGTSAEGGPQLWGNFFGSSMTYGAEADRDFAKQSDNFWGASAGLDIPLTSNLLVGVGFGGNDGQFSVLERQTSGTMDGFHTGAYAVVDLQPWYVAADLAYSHYHNDTQRTVAAFGGLSTESESGEFGSDVLRGRIELGRRFGARATVEGLSVTPYAALEAARLWNDRFSEQQGTGSNGPDLLGLSFDSNQVTSLPGMLGMKFEEVHHFANGLQFDPSVDLAWVHEFRPTREMVAQLLSMPAAPFTVQGAQPASNGAQVRAGTQVVLSSHAAFYINFQGEFSDNVHTYGGQTGVTVTW